MIFIAKLLFSCCAHRNGVGWCAAPPVRAARAELGRGFGGCALGGARSMGGANAWLLGPPCNPRACADLARCRVSVSRIVTRLSMVSEGRSFQPRAERVRVGGNLMQQGAPFLALPALAPSWHPAEHTTDGCRAARLRRCSPSSISSSSWSLIELHISTRSSRRAVRDGPHARARSSSVERAAIALRLAQPDIPVLVRLHDSRPPVCGCTCEYVYDLE